MHHLVVPGGDETGGMMIREALPAVFPNRGEEALPPVIGCNSRIDNLPYVRDWLIESQRDLELGDFGNHAVLDAGNWQERANQVKQHLSGFTGRLGIHGPFRGIVLDASDPEVQAVATKRLLQSLQFGSLVGTTHMVIHSPFAARGNPFLGFGAGSDLAGSISNIHATLEPVIRYAETIGCMLVIENIYDFNPFALLETVKSFDTKTVRLSLDVGHAQLLTRNGGMPPGQWIRETAQCLEHLHLQDGDKELDRHWAPGDGTVSWYSVFEALSWLDRQPRLIVEVKNHHEVQRGYRYLFERGLAR